MNEARYSRLTREFPERAEELFTRNEAGAKDRYEHLLVDLYKYVLLRFGCRYAAHFSPTARERVRPARAFTAQRRCTTRKRAPPRGWYAPAPPPAKVV